MSSVITKSSKKKDKRQVMENLQFRKGLHKKQKRQDWDHKAYHDVPSAIYCAVAQ